MLAKESSLTRLGYAAGLFDGEGTVGTYLRERLHPRKDGSMRRSRELRSAARIVMTDREPLELFQAVVKVGSLTGPYSRAGARQHHAAYWVWQTQRLTEIEEVFRLLRPYLSNRRWNQFEKAIKSRKLGVDHWAGEGE